MKSDYMRYRGNCKRYCDRAVRLFPDLKLVRGHYYDFMWGEQPHWWCVRPDGTIFDPTAKQFPSKGNGEYIEFDGKVCCAECGKDFMTARDENTFPVRWIWPDQAAKMLADAMLREGGDK